MALDNTEESQELLREDPAGGTVSQEDRAGRPTQSPLDDIAAVDIAAIVDSLNDGIYVCDPDRRIIYWSKSAERITGWSAEEVVGRHCFDSVLCHVDKDGHQLYGVAPCIER